MARDLTHGSITKNIAVFSVPVFLTLLFQSLFTMVDSLMIGNLASAEALGSVASCGSITFMFVYIANGYAVGYKTITGQLYGAKKYLAVRESINTSMCSMLAISLLVTVLGVAFTTPLLKVMGTVPELLLSHVPNYMKHWVHHTKTS